MGTGMWQVGFVDVARARLRVATVGRGPPVVFVVDPPNVVEHYRGLFELLAPKVRAVAFEPAGFGFSTAKPPFDFGLEPQASVVEQLLDKLDVGPYTLVAPCVAAYGAVQLASSRADLVDRLVLVQAPDWGEEVKWSRRVDPGVLRKPVLGALACGPFRKRLAAKWYEVAAATPEHAEAFAGPSLAALADGARFPLHKAFPKTFDRPAPDLPPVKQPTLLVWGTKDRTHRRTDRGSGFRLAPGATMKEFPASGHFPELEEPERFRDVLFEFLGLP